MIENTDRKNVYEGNGLNDLWPFTFEISTTDGSDIAVYITDDAGATSERLTSGYTVEVVRQSSAPNTNSRYIDVKIDHLKRFWFYWNHNLANGTGRIELHLEGYYK